MLCHLCYMNNIHMSQLVFSGDSYTVRMVGWTHQINKQTRRTFQCRTVKHCTELLYCSVSSHGLYHLFTLKQPKIFFVGIKRQKSVLSEILFSRFVFCHLFFFPPWAESDCCTSRERTRVRGWNTIRHFNDFWGDSVFMTDINLHSLQAAVHYKTGKPFHCGSACDHGTAFFWYTGDIDNK